MSGYEGEQPPIDNNQQIPSVALDAATEASISTLVSNQLQAAIFELGLNAPAPPELPPANEIPGPGSPAAGQDPAAKANKSAPIPLAAGPAAGEDARNNPPARQHAEGGEDTYDEKLIGQDPGDDPEDAYQPFTHNWYEARRGYSIPHRFEIPRRFYSSYPVVFTPESNEHYSTFRTGNASTGKASEASSLYVTPAYLSTTSNELSELVEEITTSVPRVQSEAGMEVLRNIFLQVSDDQLAIFGVYKPAAASYEVLCVQQGAAGVADLELLSAYNDPPAAFSTAGRQRQSIRYAAHLEGRLRGGREDPHNSGGGRGGEGRSGGRSGGRGGGRGAGGQGARVQGGRGRGRGRGQ